MILFQGSIWNAMAIKQSCLWSPKMIERTLCHQAHHQFRYCHTIQYSVKSRAIFDSTMDPEAFFNIKCKSAYYNLWNISQVYFQTVTVYLWSSIIFALSTTKNAELHMHKNVIIYHSGWAALAAYNTAHWLQNFTICLQGTEWPGPCLSGLPPYTIQAEKETEV